MDNLIVTNEQQTMSSLDFLNDFINPAREEAGQSNTSYKDFIVKVIDELDLAHEEIFLMDSTGGRKRKVTNLNKDQMMLVGMRESKQVRKSVLDKLKELTQPVEDPIVLLAQKVLKQNEEIKRLEKTKAQISDKRTATLMNKASQDAKRINKLEGQLQDVGTYQSLLAADIPQRVDTESKPNVQSWRLLKGITESLDYDIVKVDDQRYGKVNTYHVKAIEEFKRLYL